jgi:hypothetical protein
MDSRRYPFTSLLSFSFCTHASVDCLILFVTEQSRFVPVPLFFLFTLYRTGPRIVVLTHEYMENKLNGEKSIKIERILVNNGTTLKNV